MGIIFLICAGLVIGKVADAEQRSEWIWGLGTIALAIGISALFGYGTFFAAPLAMVLAFGTMFAINVIRD